MTIAKSKEEFEAAAQGLTRLPRVDLSARVKLVEPLDGMYFKDNSRQRCIVEKDGKLFVSDYD